MSDEKFIELNNELLVDQADTPPLEAKRNSKQSIINKIVEISEANDIPLEHSNTKLKRMSKSELADLCAELIEKSVRKQVARKVGCPEGDCSDQTIALNALRMVHDMVANLCEKGGNAVLDKYDYEIAGFTETLQEPNTSNAINGCLEEISRESEILEHIKSPYTRLAIAWGGALAFSIRKKRTIRYVTPMEPRSASSNSRGCGRFQHCPHTASTRSSRSARYFGFR